MSTHIDTNYFVKLGGDIRRPPYIDTVGRGIYQEDHYRARVFVSALWYPTWESWSEAARIAIDTAIRGTNPIVVDRGITISSATELEPTPSYIFDNGGLRMGVLSILLNAAAITTEDEYEATLIIAEARRRIIEQGLAKKDNCLYQYTKYNAAENGTRYIWDELEDAGAIKNRRCSSLFTKHDPAEESREALIQEFMRLEIGK